MAYTLAEARTRIQDDFLDDPNKRRFTDARVDRALRASLSNCMFRYSSAGGHRWVQESADLTIANGELDLDTVSISPITIFKVYLRSGDSNSWDEVIRAAAPGSDGARSGVGGTVRMLYLPSYAMPTTTTNYLVGDSTTVYSWDAFDEWICLEAAKNLSHLDGQVSVSLAQLAAEAEQDVHKTTNTVPAKGLPSRRDPRSAHYHWSYVPNTLRLSKSGV